jgi:tetratricopeptide (TPR) repeat protein
MAMTKTKAGFQTAGWLVTLVAIPMLSACNQNESAYFSPKDYCESGRRHLSNASFIQKDDVLTNETARKECNSAINDFNKALASDPRCLSALGGRAIGYFRSGLLQLALTDFNYCIKLEPAKSGWHFNKSLVLVHLGRAYEAFDEMKLALSLEKDTTNRQAIVNRLATFGHINL